MASAAEDPYRDEALCCRCGKDDSNYADEMRRLSYCKRCGHSLCVQTVVGVRTPALLALVATLRSRHALARALCRCQACMAQTFGAIGGGRGRGHTVAMCPAPGCNKTVQVSDFGFKRPEDEEYEAEIKARKYVTSMCVPPNHASARVYAARGSHDPPLPLPPIQPAASTSPRARLGATRRPTTTTWSGWRATSRHW